MMKLVLHSMLEEVFFMMVSCKNVYDVAVYRRMDPRLLTSHYVVMFNQNA
jgi:hypothetical protein